MKLDPITGLVAFVLGFVGAAFAQSIAAYPHEHYDYIYSQDGTNCCNGKDCQPFDGIEVKPVEGGYFVPKFNVTVPMAKTGYSPDHRWHICLENVGEHGGKKLRCLLVPAGGA